MQPQFVTNPLDGRLAPSVAPGAAADTFGEQALSQRATLAVALAPVLVLLALTMVIGDLIEPYLGLAGVLLSVAWLVLEMHQYQRALALGEDEPGAALGLVHDER